MKKLIGLIVLLVAAVGGYFVWLEMQKTETTDDAQIDGRIIAISPRIGGHITEVLVEDEQVVKKGDVLVKLDPKDYEVAVARARADLLDATAQLQTLRGDVPLTGATTDSVLNSAKAGRQDAAVAVSWNEQQKSVAEAKMASAQANVKVAEANATKAAQDVERYRVLVAKDEISKQQYDQSVAASEAAKATVEAAKSMVNEERHAISAAEVAVEQAKARLAQAEANVQTAMTGPQQVAITESRVNGALAKVAQYKASLEQAELNLSYTTITAPVDGVVGRKNVDVGQNTAPGQQMMALVSLDDVWVVANFKETQLREMKIGQPVKIEVDAYRRAD